MGYDAIKKLNQFTQTARESAEQAAKDSEIRTSEGVRLFAPVLEAMRAICESGAKFGDEEKPLSPVASGATEYTSPWYMGRRGPDSYTDRYSFEMRVSLSEGASSPFYFRLMNIRCRRLEEARFQTAEQLLDFALGILARYRQARCP